VDETKRIGLLYSWSVSETFLAAWAVWMVILGGSLALLWSLRLLFLGRGPGRWAASVLERMQAQRAQTGSWFAFTPTYAWHHRQAIRFQLVYLLFVVCTCGVGLIIGAPFYITWLMRARREAEAGGWPLLPIVGRWQPEPPVA
jgi:hypothetical protein